MLPGLDVFGEWSQLGLDQTFGGSWEGLATGDYYSWLAGVEFSALARASNAPLLYRFADAPVGPADINLFSGLRARSGPYDFTFQED